MIIRYLDPWGQGSCRSLPSVFFLDGVHVPMQYILGPETFSYVGTSGPKYAR